MVGVVAVVRNADISAGFVNPNSRRLTITRFETDGRVPGLLRQAFEFSEQSTGDTLAADVRFDVHPFHFCDSWLPRSKGPAANGSTIECRDQEATSRPGGIFRTKVARPVVAEITVEDDNVSRKLGNEMQCRRAARVGQGDDEIR